MRQRIHISYDGVGPVRNVKITNEAGEMIEGVSQVSFEWDATDASPEIMLWIYPDKLDVWGLVTVAARCPKCGENLGVQQKA